MIIDDKAANARLASPLNLINRLKKATKNDAMQLFTGPLAKQGKLVNPFEKRLAPPVELPIEQETTLDTILQDSDTQIRLGLAHDKSLALLTKTVDMIDSKLDDISASKLPAVVGAVSRVVESIRKERLIRSAENDREVHYHFYTPQQKKIEEYEIIEVQ